MRSIYSLCSLSTLAFYLQSRGIPMYREDGDSTYRCFTNVDVLSDELFMFTGLCNLHRNDVYGYELCEDVCEDYNTRTFYIMREDGECMLEFPVKFVVK